MEKQKENVALLKVTFSDKVSREDIQWVMEAMLDHINYLREVVSDDQDHIINQIDIAEIVEIK